MFDKEFNSVHLAQCAETLPENKLQCTRSRLSLEREEDKLMAADRQHEILGLM